MEINPDQPREKLSEPMVVGDALKETFNLTDMAVRSMFRRVAELDLQDALKAQLQATKGSNAEQDAANQAVRQANERLHEVRNQLPPDEG